jgi:hypothetical protein
MMLLKFLLLMTVLGALEAASQGDPKAVIFLVIVFVLYAKRHWIIRRWNYEP